MELSKLFIASSIALTLLVGCDNREIVYEKVYEVDGDEWLANQGYTFEVDIDDPLANYNFYFQVRNKSTYEYSNLYLFVDGKFPDAGMHKDTIECFLADPTGKWLGNGSGEIIDNQILFKQQVKLPVSGKYVFTFWQGMREEALIGIKDVGLVIERAH